MKKKLLIISVIIIFTTVILIFWYAFLPFSFISVFKKNPLVYKIIEKSNFLDSKTEERFIATTSEPILGTSGKILVENKIWDVEIAINNDARINGLSSRNNLHTSKGMLFVFPDMFEHSFWMKDMLLPIDMIFFNDNWNVVLIESNVQPDSFPQIFGSNVKSQYVLEVNAFEAKYSNLKVGDQAIFLNK